MRDRLLPQFKGNQSALARRLQTSQSALNRFLSGTQGTSIVLAERIAAELGVPLWDLLLGKERPALRDLPGFQQAFKEARRVAGDQYPESIWDTVARNQPNPTPERVDSYLLLQVAAVQAALLKR